MQSPQMAPFSCGSSPRMWGTRRLRAGRRHLHRFIPTHVGNTPGNRPSQNRVTVHPHACGEHLDGIVNWVGGLGSSPRMWGTLKHFTPTSDSSRFIPTHVGNTPGVLRARFRLPVHPHACGEHFLFTTSSSPVVGSSPRMWGTPYPGYPLRSAARFIPTHVGNTSSSGPSKGPTPVHPHACGEHPGDLIPERPFNGSSPRMWGTLHGPRGCRPDARFIPTHVGNTFSFSFSASISSVHPHACGEHATELTKDPVGAGSSPRMWGTHDVGEEDALDHRFIPTHVGNTSHSTENRQRIMVHPHACGEHVGACRDRYIGIGSSPRMWGTRDGNERSRVRCRFIPTHVGNTTGATKSCLGFTVHPHACGEHRYDDRTA